MYLGIRKYYQDFTEEWLPTQNGFNVEYNMHSTLGLFSALTKILSTAETLETINEELAKKIQ